MRLCKLGGEAAGSRRESWCREGGSGVLRFGIVLLLLVGLVGGRIGA